MSDFVSENFDEDEFSENDDFSADEDNDYQPTAVEIRQEEEDLRLEVEEGSGDEYENEQFIESMTQSFLEEIARNPNAAYLSKDKKIEYHSEPFEPSRRTSYSRNLSIASGAFCICFV